MDVQIRDSAALRRITPTMLRAYLQAQEWVQEETWRGRIVVWSKTHGDEVHEILMPLREQSDVYAVRMSEAVVAISEIEERSQLDIYYDLLGAGADVIRLRSLNGVGQQELSLSDRADFLTHARDLVAAAARSAERPGQAVYRGRYSGTVTDYVRGIRPLPGYETGSELVLHSKVPADYGTQHDLGDAFRSPFPRRAVIALNNGLSQADNTAQAVLGGAEISTFQSATNQGVSANLCEAVAAMAKQWHGIKVNLSWAVVRPSDAPDGEFEFVESAAEVFEDGAKWLRRNSPFLGAQVTGEIVKLERDSQEKFDGQAVVLYELDSRPVALQVHFDIADKEQVRHAFEQAFEISVEGDIHRKGRQYFLENPRNFAVLEQMR